MVTQLNNSNNTIDQPGNPDAGLQATAAEPQRPRTMLDLINNFPGKPWYDAAGPLAQWTLERLVNRDDAYRGYRWLDYRVPGRGITFTAPWNEDDRLFGALNREIIEGHFRGDQERLLGLHAISVENTSKWFAVDVDQHGADGPVLVEENIDAAFSWYGVLQALGFDPLFLDANGEGGFHLLVCLSAPVPSQVVHGFVTELVQDFGVYGLKKAPDAIPLRFRP